ncbi:hypothetical protein EOD39_7263 [Acipenser ruthenus]|uniref:Uncharacterized protein n=1 Tax=Acipenser ruthenus TaxID=7906 RepID=A0A444U7D2_ACIRT|nr:hypothetical protein EOD39_7263 [Acipenser ruthenus]
MHLHRVLGTGELEHRMYRGTKAPCAPDYACTVVLSTACTNQHCGPRALGATRTEFTECTEHRLHLALYALNVPSTATAMCTEVLDTGTPNTVRAECTKYHAH